MKCKHKRTRRGKDIDRLYGSDRTRRCVDCKKWRRENHLGLALSSWRKTGYEKETEDKPDLW